MAKKKANAGKHAKSAAAQKLRKPDASVLKAYPFLVDFFAFPWKKVAPRNAYGIYALCLYGNYSDYLDVATDALTEGGDDRDVDFCYIDLEEREIFIGQSYLSEDWGKLEASSNKAEDLLTGFSWLLKPDLQQIPKQIREKAREVQEAIQAHDIGSIHLLYTHNCQQSDNVKRALENVAHAAKILVQDPSISVTVVELGLQAVEHLYESLTKLIVVEDQIDFDIGSLFEEDGEGWKAVSTTISGDKLRSLWNSYRKDLFGANVRGFPQMLNRKKSINSGIMETILQEPSRFWAYNNGIAILTKEITVRATKIRASGISIINGAQTTGVIGSSPPENAKRVRVPCRFIQCDDPDLVQNIILKNNTQNEIRSFDLRSNDPTQRKLCEEFKEYNITYVHRREGALRLPEGAIQAETLAPYLAAFHGFFQIATRQRRNIFEDRSTYGEVFRTGIVAEHLYLIQALADAVSLLKLEINEKKGSGRAGAVESTMFDLLQHSTAKSFVVGVVGELAELIVGRKVPSRIDWIVARQYVKPERSRVVTAWKFALEAILPLIVAQVGNGVTGYEIVRSQVKLLEVAGKLTFSAYSIRKQLNSEFSALRDMTELGAQ